MTEISLIYTTFPDKDSATNLSSKLLNEKLIACANIFPSGTSIYEWQGKVETSDEVYCILKTKKDLVEKLKHRYLELHPYDCPCFIEIKVNSANDEFSNWIKEQVL